MKRRTALSVMIGVAAAPLAACSGSPTGSSSGKATDLSAELSLGMWDPVALDGVKAQIADFNSLYPNIKVTPELSPYDQYWTKLQTQGSSGTLPDVFWMNDLYIKLYGSNGLLEPLSDLVESKQIDLANYPKALNERFTVDGKVYGVMVQIGSNGVWYNKSIFKKAGLPYPKAGWTWDDFRGYAGTITQKLGSGGVYGVASELAAQTSYYNTIYQNKGYVISPDGKSSGYGEPQSVSGLEFWSQLVHDGYHPAPQQLADNPGNKMFQSGKSGMYWGGSWSVKEMKESGVADDIDVVTLPRGETKGSIVAGLTNVISAKSRNIDAAKAFVAYLSSKRAALIMAKQGSLIPSFNGSQGDWVAAAPHYNLQAFVDAATTDPFLYPVSKNTGAWNQLETKFLPDAFAGKTPMPDAASHLAQEMTAVLATE